jgi:predicted DNA-binding protein (MmcQ/YjbR family)
MTLGRFRDLCLAQPGATEQIQWGVDAVFKIGGKMFAVACTDHTAYPDAPVCSFKCDEETFAELVEQEGVIPAPYLARAKWVAATEWSALTDREFTTLVSRACELVRAGLSKKLQATLPGGVRSADLPHPPANRNTRPRRTTR